MLSDAFPETNGQALLRAKKTFLMKFKFCPNDDSDRARRVSAPSCIARPCADEEMWSTDIVILSEDHVLWNWSSTDLESDVGVHENYIQEDLLEDESDLGKLDLPTSELHKAASSAVLEKAFEEEEEGETRCVCTEPQTDSLCTIPPIPGKATMTTKTTFLDFKFVADDDSIRVRRISAPAFVGFRVTDEDIWKREVSTNESCEQVLWTSHADENKQMFPNALREDADTEGSKRKSPSKAKRDRIRHCKGKRMRYKKFIMHLFEQIDEDPEGFDTALIQWPPSLMDNSESRDYLLDLVRTHRARALENNATKVDVCTENYLQLEPVL